jgi:serine/threonine-protein kinase
MNFPTLTSEMAPGTILADRYRVVKVLGQGGFGRTYLAEDSNRFQEYCVLKEFIPQVHSSQSLQKAQDLFEREADVLYRLNHPQIPRFREMLRTQHNGQGYLLLVQDYVEGKTYRELQRERQSRGLAFNEAETYQLLFQLLPVLAYLHANGVIHRDISPENLIQRQNDGLPVLIDFGGVKQAAASSLSNESESNLTCLGKTGYAPPEQLQQGKVYPHSDLYALAVTLLVLLTGKEPPALLNSQTLAWQWQQEVQVSPQFANLLNRMLAQQPGDRYPSAAAVLLALSGTDPDAVSLKPALPPQTATTVAAVPSATPPAPPPPDPQDLNQTVATPVTATSTFGATLAKLATTLLFGLVFIAAGLGGWWVTRAWQQFTQANPPLNPSSEASPAVVTPPPYSAEEQARKDNLEQQRQALGISSEFLNQLVDDRFYQKYPERLQRPLTRDSADEALRAEWDQLAQDWLNQLQPLSSEQRSRLGSYSQDNFRDWVAQVNGEFLSSRALIDLADGRFFELLPDQRNQNFESTPVMQIWWSIADETTAQVLNKQILQKIEFQAGAANATVGKSLEPGEGIAYIAYLVTKQPVRFHLNAPNDFLFSIYPPFRDSLPLLADSNQRDWDGVVQDSGYYEFVIVSAANSPAQFSLEVTAELNDQPDDKLQPFFDNSESSENSPSSQNSASPENAEKNDRPNSDNSDIPPNHDPPERKKKKQ